MQEQKTHLLIHLDLFIFVEFQLKNTNILGDH